MSALILSGVTLLPEEEISALAGWCQRHLDARRVFHYGDHLEPALDVFRQRRLIVGEMQLFLMSHYSRLRFNLEAQRAVAALNHRGARGRELVLAAIRAMPLPSADAPGRGTAWKQPWQKMIWDAWSAGDLELLVAALERSAVQIVITPGDIRLPRLPHASEYYPVADDVPSASGIPLAELWARLRADIPECLSGILASMVRSAEGDPLAAQVLLVACWEDQLREDETRLPVAGVLEMLESPTSTVTGLGLELLARCPSFLSGHLTEAIEVVSRCVAAPPIGPARNAARALATLATTHPEQRPTILQELTAALDLPRPTVVVQVMRSMLAIVEAMRSRPPGKEGVAGEQPAPARPILDLDAATCERIEELARDNPARYGKLVAKLLLAISGEGAPE